MKTHGADLGWLTNDDYPFLEGRWRGNPKQKREIERMKEMKRNKRKPINNSSPSFFLV
jgi:hypothetical protein